MFIFKKNFSWFLKFSVNHKSGLYIRLVYFVISNYIENLNNTNILKKNQFELKFSFFLYGNQLNFFILLIKNLLRVFYKRYRTIIIRQRLSRIIGSFRLNLLKWSHISDFKISSKFNLPLVFGSRSFYTNFKRNDWLYLLRFGVNNENYAFYLDSYFDFLKKVIRFFPRRRLLLLNRVFVARIKVTKNNIFFTFFFINGRTLISSSAGSAGFKGKKKKTPLAAKKTAIIFSKKVKSVLLKLRVKIENSFFIVKLYGKSSSSVFKEALNGLRIEKFPCNLILDTKPISHGGLRRLKKPRRV